MIVQTALTTVFASVLSMLVASFGLPRIAYTLPDRLAVFTSHNSSFGVETVLHEAMAGLRAP